MNERFGKKMKNETKSKKNDESKKEMKRT